MLLGVRAAVVQQPKGESAFPEPLAGNYDKPSFLLDLIHCLETLPRTLVDKAMPRPTAMRIDEKMMHAALEQAKLGADAQEVPVGAVVYHDDRVLARAHNLREALNDPTAHAEILALRRAADVLGTWRLDDCSMAVTLEPCPMCAGALVNARVARLVYGATDPKMGCVDTLHRLCTDHRFNHRLEVVGEVCADESGRLLTEFSRISGNPGLSPRCPS